MKKTRICRKEPLFMITKKNKNQKPIKEDRRESISSSSLDSSSLFLHRFYATYAPRLEEVVLVELQSPLIQE